MRTLRYLFFASAIAAACGDSDPSEGRLKSSLFQTVPQDPSFPGTPGDETQFGSLFDYEPLDCKPTNSVALGIRAELRVFRGDGVTDAQVNAFLGGLQRYFDHYQVKMFTRYEVISVPLAHAMVVDEQALLAKLSEDGIDLRREPPTAEESEVQLKALGRAVMYNIREFLRIYADPLARSVNVLLLKEMVGGSASNPELAALARSITGLGLSPQLLRGFSEDDPGALLYEWVNPGTDFTPVAIVGTRLAAQLLPHPDVIIAHEIGHSYGLFHTATAMNLMTQGQLDCQASLDVEQLERLRTSLEQASHTLSVESLSSSAHVEELVVQLHRAMEHFRSAD